MGRWLVTGGSGFIGTNLVEQLLTDGEEVLNLDIKDPQNSRHSGCYRRLDIIDAPSLQAAFREFAPTRVVHLAARTDLDGKRIGEYQVNTTGVQNVVDAVRTTSSVQTSLFASTKIVCANGRYTEVEDDFGPDTIYGESKVQGEKIVRQAGLESRWFIVRPTSIWGPWFNVPYRAFFIRVARRKYVHPGRIDPPKNFGYVGNTIHQIRQLFEARSEQVDGHVFYLADYFEYRIRDWAERIAGQTGVPGIRQVPGPVIRLGAFAGDLLKAIGFADPPLTSFRLKNLRTDTSGMPAEALREITGPHPCSLDDGIRETVHWMREQGML